MKIGLYENIIKKLEEEITYSDADFEQYVNEYSPCLDSEYDDFFYRGLERALKLIKQEEEQYNNGWIPCSERLPQIPDGTDDDNCPEFNVIIESATQATTLKYLSDGSWVDAFGEIYHVVAWQPLPEIYQQKGEQEA